ncbi:MAG: hypothetical protein A2X30_03940 [Elusimicrobia bacterium GWB2_63_16]|nr:MAG: hypothetical protein A2X30_03940 [Elusimicrobia bacterium GWB2_63_16]
MSVTMKKVLLVAPSYSFIYQGAKIQPGAMYSPSLGIAAVAGALLAAGHEVRICDLNKKSESELLLELREFAPDYAGISFTTVLAAEAGRLAGVIKKGSPKTLVMAGGVHASSMPEDTLSCADIDYAFIGEADFSAPEVVSGKPLPEVAGLAYREGGKIVVNPRRELICDLDTLPYPAWHLFEVGSYSTTRLLTRANPAGWLETSRGCPYGCVYCNKSVFGRGFRVKSAERVVEEIAYMLRCGFKEIHIADDCFTVDLDRAKRICRGILGRGLKFPWATVTGIRADRVDQELLDLMKAAGCYRIFYGIESGSDEVLKRIGKGETLAQVRAAVTMAKKAGLEVHGFFMLALPGDTEKTMRATIDFAKELDLDMAKAAITIPLPATPYFEELSAAGRIKSRDWSKYNLYFPASTLYDHPTLSWDLVEEYYKKFYREFYFRPGYILKRLVESVRSGRLLHDIGVFLRVKW